MKDYLPDSHLNLLNWLKNLKIKLAADAVTLGWDPARITAANAILDPLIAAYQALVDAENTLSAAGADASQSFRALVGPLRDLVGGIKTSPGFTDGMGDEMKIFTGGNKPGPAAIKPRITAVSEPGHVRIAGTKDYAELYNLYMRRAGTVNWILVGVNRKKFPFDDQTPLAAPGVPEQREYRARGVINDQEVGEFSDVVLVTFNG